MKKMLIAALCALALAGGILAKLYLIGTKPLRGLTVEEVTAATVELYPPDATLELTQEEIKKLIPILNQVVIFQRDDAYRESCGQAVIFTLIQTDGTQLRVQAYNPFLVINGEDCRTKYGPCEELNQLGNDLLRERHGD